MSSMVETSVKIFLHHLFQTGEGGKFEVDFDFIYDRADDLICSALFCVVGRGDEIDTLLTKKLLGYIRLLLVGWVIDCD